MSLSVNILLVPHYVIHVATSYSQQNSTTDRGIVMEMFLLHLMLLLGIYMYSTEFRGESKVALAVNGA